MPTLTMLSIFNFTSWRKKLTGYYTIIKKEKKLAILVVKYRFPTKQVNERLKTQVPESRVIKISLEKLSETKK